MATRDTESLPRTPSASSLERNKTDQVPSPEEHLARLAIEGGRLQNEIARLEEALAQAKAEHNKLREQREAIKGAKGNNQYHQRLESIRASQQHPTSAYESLMRESSQIRQLTLFLHTHITPLVGTLQRLLQKWIDYSTGNEQQQPLDHDSSHICPLPTLRQYDALFPDPQNVGENVLTIQSFVDTYLNPEITQHIIVDYHAADDKEGRSDYYIFRVYPNPVRTTPDDHSGIS